VADVLSTCASLGIQITWRDKGASFRLPNADRADPLSIGWLLPEGSHWARAKYLTFRVDGESLKQVPTLAEPVARYVARVSNLPGARLVSSKRADRFVFEPPVAVANVDAIRQALSDLVAEVNQ
jgi:hypothetical protein